MKILILDNYDSFTFNLVQIIENIIQTEVVIVQNDKIELNEILQFDKIILSPGPGMPKDAGKLLEVISTFKDKIPMLGVCLGHQAIAEVFNGKLKQLDQVQHGVTSRILETNDDELFAEIKLPMTVGRYHSWVVDEQDFPCDSIGFDLINPQFFGL